MIMQRAVPSAQMLSSKSLCRSLCSAQVSSFAGLRRVAALAMKKKHVENGDVPTLKKGGSAKKHDEDEDFIYRLHRTWKLMVGFLTAKLLCHVSWSIHRTLHYWVGGRYLDLARSLVQKTTAGDILGLLGRAKSKSYRCPETSTKKHEAMQGVTVQTLQGPGSKAPNVLKSNNLLSWKAFLHGVSSRLHMQQTAWPIWSCSVASLAKHAARFEFQFEMGPWH